MKKIIAYAFIGALAISAGSCSLFQKNETSSTEAPAKSGKAKKASVLPQDRQAIIQKANAKTYTPEEFAKGVVKGDWAIETVFGQEAVGEKAPYLKFSDSDHRVYGNNGCNTVNGDYQYNASKSTLKFSNVIVTMMMCAKEGITDTEINRALNETASYSLNENESGYTMTLFDASGEEVMTLSHQNFEFLNGTWKVVAINEEPVNIEKMKLVFDIDEHKIHGNTGCNVLNGTLDTDMDAPNSISFENMAVTMMLCPQMEYQTALLVALEDACRAKPTGKNQVEFYDPTGKQVLVLERTSDK